MTEEYVDVTFRIREDVHLALAKIAELAGCSTEVVIRVALAREALPVAKSTAKQKARAK